MFPGTVYCRLPATKPRYQGLYISVDWTYYLAFLLDAVHQFRSGYRAAQRLALAACGWVWTLLEMWKKLEARKRLVKRTESHTSAARCVPGLWVAGILFGRRKNSKPENYSKTAQNPRRPVHPVRMARPSFFKAVRESPS
jgi:hypothetical protein